MIDHKKIKKEHKKEFSKSSLLQIRLREGLLDAINDRAKSKNMGASDWVRNVLEAQCLLQDHNWSIEYEVTNG